MHLMHLFGNEMRAALLCLRELQNKIQMQPADMSFEKKKKVTYPSRKPALKYVAIWQQKMGQPGYMGGSDDGSVCC